MTLIVTGDPETKLIPGETHLSVDDPLLNPLVLRARLQRHGVHATLPAVIPHAQPVLLDALQIRVAPREEVSAGRRRVH